MVAPSVRVMLGPTSTERQCLMLCVTVCAYCASYECDLSSHVNGVYLKKIYSSELRNNFIQVSSVIFLTAHIKAVHPEKPMRV